MRQKNLLKRAEAAYWNDQFNKSTNPKEFWKLSSFKCLGLTIDNRLSWQDHIRNICKLFNKKLAVLKRIKFLSHSILESIYFNSIIPSVVYNIVVWGSVSSALMEDIERIHMRALQIVYKLPMTTPTDEIKKLRQ